MVCLIFAKTEYLIIRSKYSLVNVLCTWMEKKMFNFLLRWKNQNNNQNFYLSQSIIVSILQRRFLEKYVSFSVHLYISTYIIFFINRNLSILEWFDVLRFFTMDFLQLEAVSPIIKWLIVRWYLAVQLFYFTSFWAN